MLVFIDTDSRWQADRTHPMHNINKDLRIVPREATDRVTLILTREDCFDQGGEFTQNGCASDQRSAGWNVEN